MTNWPKALGTLITTVFTHSLSPHKRKTVSTLAKLN